MEDLVPALKLWLGNEQGYPGIADEIPPYDRTSHSTRWAKWAKKELDPIKKKRKLEQVNGSDNGSENGTLPASQQTSNDGVLQLALASPPSASDSTDGSDSSSLPGSLDELLQGLGEHALSDHLGSEIMEFASRRIREEIDCINALLRGPLEIEERTQLETRLQSRRNLLGRLQGLHLDSEQFRTALVFADSTPIGIADDAGGVLAEVGPQLNAVLFGASSGTSGAPASGATTTIFSCPNGLAAVPAECLAIQQILGDAARLVPQASVEQAPAALAGVTQAHLAGHHDAELCGMRTFAWTKEGRIEVVDQSTLVRLLRKLELVVLNGCKSEAAGEALVREGVRDVICWSSLTSDVPGRLFAEGFWSTLAQGGSVGDAFEAGWQRIRTATRWDGARVCRSGARTADCQTSSV